MPKAWFLSPYPAPSIAAFGEKGPQHPRGIKGAARMPLVFGGAGKPLPKTLAKYPRGTSARSAGSRRDRGGFFFGFFLLAERNYSPHKNIKKYLTGFLM